MHPQPERNGTLYRPMLELSGRQCAALRRMTNSSRIEFDLYSLAAGSSLRSRRRMTLLLAVRGRDSRTITWCAKHNTLSDLNPNRYHL